MEIRNTLEELKTLKDTVIVYHGGCNDGLTAAACVEAYRNAYNLEIPTYIAGEYGKVGQYDDVKDKNILFVDFSPTLDNIKQLVNNGNHIFVLDHHKTFKDLLDSEEFANYWRETTERLQHVYWWGSWYFENVSGAAVTYDFFRQLGNNIDIVNFPRVQTSHIFTEHCYNRLPHFICEVSDSDTFARPDDIDTRNLSIGLKYGIARNGEDGHSFLNDYNIYNESADTTKPLTMALVAKGQMIYDVMLEEYKSLCRNQPVFELPVANDKPYRFMVINAPGSFSTGLSVYAYNEFDLDLVITFSLDSGKAKLGFRAPKENRYPILHLIASEFVHNGRTGGGHPTASGATISAFEANPMAMLHSDFWADRIYAAMSRFEILQTG